MEKFVASLGAVIVFFAVWILSYLPVMDRSDDDGLFGLAVFVGFVVGVLLAAGEYRGIIAYFDEQKERRIGKAGNDE
jgi:hypothetical protein